MRGRTWDLDPGFELGTGALVLVLLVAGLLGLYGGRRAYRGTWRSWTTDIPAKALPDFGLGAAWAGAAALLCAAGITVGELLPNLRPNVPGIVLMGLGIVLLWFALICSRWRFPNTLTPAWLREERRAGRPGRGAGRRPR